MLALDVGRKRIGLAVSGPDEGMALGIETLHRKTLREDVVRLARIARERGVRHVVVGLPLHMDGEESPMAKQARIVADKLREESALPVEMHDERLTSVEAEERLKARGWSLKRLIEEKKKGAVDQMAAVLLLEDWLSAKGRGEASA